MDLDATSNPLPYGTGLVFDLLILSDIRFIREGLADVLGRDSTFRIAGVAVDLQQACSLVSRTPPRIILIDTALPEGIAAVETLKVHARGAKIVAFALRETETEVIAWARAGICGYIPRSTPLSALVGLLNNVVHGEQVCPTWIASGMLRWIAQNAQIPERAGRIDSSSVLTAREQQVARLMGSGLSNKEIARHLDISVATTKSHVHNILAKLGVSKRTLAARQLGEHTEWPPVALPRT